LLTHSIIQYLYKSKAADYLRCLFWVYGYIYKWDWEFGIGFPDSKLLSIKSAAIKPNYKLPIPDSFTIAS
jgi:hypothetical protein